MKIMIMFVLASSIFLFKFCSRVLPDDKFTLIRKSNFSKKLRIDGYYFEKGVNDKIYSVNIFYNNGINLYAGGNYSIKELEELLINSNWLKRISTEKTWWGLYEINDDIIKFERYYPSSGGPLPAYIRSGKILNDTTFIITQSMRSNGTEVREKNETYHFRPFSPKPDSINNFIK